VIAILVAAKIRLMGSLVAQFRCRTFRRSRPACQCNRASVSIARSGRPQAALELEPNSLTCVSRRNPGIIRHNLYPDRSVRMTGDFP
jgi:hypothetical protein